MKTIEDFNFKDKQAFDVMIKKIDFQIGIKIIQSNLASFILNYIGQTL